MGHAQVMVGVVTEWGACTSHADRASLARARLAQIQDPKAGFLGPGGLVSVCATVLVLDEQVQLQRDAEPATGAAGASENLRCARERFPAGLQGSRIPGEQVQPQRDAQGFGRRPLRIGPGRSHGCFACT